MKQLYGIVRMATKPQLVLTVFLAGMLAGCKTRHMIIAATGTSIGVEISENPASQTPQAKLGYHRAELALVPTNWSANADPGDKSGGASEHGDVLMEIKHSGIFSTGEGSGIYQRLAVGETAVQQHGAAFMFARDAKGQITDEAIQALGSIPVRSEQWYDKFDELSKAYVKAPGKQGKVDEKLKEWRLGTWDDVTDEQPVKLTIKRMNKLIEILEAE